VYARQVCKGRPGGWARAERARRPLGAVARTVRLWVGAMARLVRPRGLAVGRANRFAGRWNHPAGLGFDMRLHV
jgi:hypothetical protein